MKILLRILMKFFLTSIIQVLFYLLTVYILWYATVDFWGPTNKHINEFAVNLSIFLFAVLATIQNLIDSTINKKWVTIVLATLTSGLYLIAWIEDMENFPFSATIFILTGLLSFALKFYVDRRIEKYLDKTPYNG